MHTDYAYCSIVACVNVSTHLPLVGHGTLRVGWLAVGPAQRHRRGRLVKKPRWAVSASARAACWPDFTCQTYPRALLVQWHIWRLGVPRAWRQFCLRHSWTAGRLCGCARPLSCPTSLHLHMFAQGAGVVDGSSGTATSQIWCCTVKILGC
eukprot:COSAG02_NODE_1548_length_11970_cov_43.634235_7_plen_151_part_00